MRLSQVLDQLQSDQGFQSCVTAWRVQPAKEGAYADFPAWLEPRLAAALKVRGIEKLYSHQAQAIQAVADGKHVVVVTPTASGKTLCYNLPVLDTVLKKPQARAMYLFPTKALSQDQYAELHELIMTLGADIKTYTYDGDTPQSARKLIRSAGHIVVTNPDMLHTGILPHHTKWVRLFENLEYVVIDEVHHYRGVFGSHLANLIRRLRRICQFYGSRPRFVCCSATIANPQELAQRLIEEPVELVDQSGAPLGEKHLIFYNPPVVNKELGIRRSSVSEASNIAANLVANDVQTIVFARSRVLTEILLTYLKEAATKRSKSQDSIRGYRGGYLPLQRREIERGLRQGTVRGVVATNALELGIDIGRLEACVMAGYPGTIASTWQQAGRAGRRTDVSAAVLVASSSPLDQFIVNNPAYFFGQSPEHGLINPDNLLILTSHLKCAAFELPFRDDETFGVPTTQEILRFLADAGLLHHAGDAWHWMSEAYPAEDISLRTASTENFVVIDTTRGSRIIGEVDRYSAPMLIHQDAIYIHEGQQYHVDKLDWEEKKAYVRQVDVDYYTDANLSVNIGVLDEFDSAPGGQGKKSHGEVKVTSLATIYKKVKLHTHENVGWGRIQLPEQEMHTTAYWLAFPEAMAGRMRKEDLQGGLLGVANLLVNVAPLYLMCDPRDIRVVPQVRSPFTGQSTVYLYDNYPGGIGFSPKLFQIHDQLVETALNLTRRCPCPAGCPSCVGPANEVGDQGKAAAVSLLSSVA
ncbi:MAG: DEAD/DEAH box helicase [Chloroflexota bacterium]